MELCTARQLGKPIKMKAIRDIGYAYDEYGIDFKQGVTYIFEPVAEGEWYCNETENGSGVWVTEEELKDGFIKSLITERHNPSSQNKYYIDETDEIFSYEEIKNHFENKMTSEERAEYNYNFEDYLTCCMWFNGGTLMPFEEEDFEDGEEICPYCNCVNDFTVNKNTRAIVCKECGNKILLCSLCGDHYICGQCPYKNERVGVNYYQEEL